MKILAFGDIHMATQAISSISELQEADLVLLNGDLTNYGKTADAKKILDAVMAINPNVLAQYGNLDHPEINNYLQELDINLHGQARLVHGKVCLIGVGGSNPTPFNTPSEFTEQELQTIVTEGFRQGNDFAALAEPLHNQKIPVILVSHPPPFNTKVDKIRSGQHVGSTAIRTAIEHFRPDLCICGHIHEAKGEDLIADTPVVNPGMLKDGGWLSIVVNQSQLEISLQ